MRKLFLIICILGTSIISGCSSEQWKSYKADYINSMYTNEHEIASNNTYTLNDIQQKVDGQDYSGQIEFAGIDTIWKLNADSKTDVDISYSLSVKNGTVKLVLVDSYGNVKTIAESDDRTDNCDCKSTTLRLKQGENIIKLVSKSNKTAEINLEFKASNGKIYKIGDKKQ